MKELSLFHRFCLLALNANTVGEMTAQKRAAVRCIPAAAVAECLLESTLARECERALSKEIAHTALTEAISCLLRRDEGPTLAATTLLERVNKLPTRKLAHIERVVYEELAEQGVIEKAGALLSCDLFFDSAGVEIYEYRAQAAVYSAIVEELRAEILEGESFTDDGAIMLWLLRESGCFVHLFSGDEIASLTHKMGRCYSENELLHSLMPIRLHKPLEFGVSGLLRVKRRILATPAGVGIKFVFPILERSQSMFIDTERYFQNKEERLDDLRARLEKHGHTLTPLTDSDTPLVRIDNRLYNVIPTAVVCNRIPVQGVRLRRYPVY